MVKRCDGFLYTFQCVMSDVVEEYARSMLDTFERVMHKGDTI
jgi:hypothetical protein